MGVFAEHFADAQGDTQYYPVCEVCGAWLLQGVPVVSRSKAHACIL
jgi:hypothetical protein